MELRSWQRQLPRILELRANIVAISPQTVESSRDTARNNDVTFSILSDRGNDVARHFGLVIELPEALQHVYKKMGHDITHANADAGSLIPLVATFVIGQNGTILHSTVNPDHTRRVDPEHVIQLLTEMRPESHECGEEHGR